MIRYRPTSAAGIISLLHDDLYQLHEFAVRRLNDIVDEFWFEIADSIPIIESFSETEKFGERKLASLLASKLHYHLASYDVALKYALGAGELLFMCENIEFLNIMINRCIESYKRVRQIEDCWIDPRLEFIIDKIFDKCLREGQYCDAIGLALETRRMDVLEKVILSCEDPSSILDHTFNITVSLFNNHKTQKYTLRCLADIYKRMWNPDFIKFCKCLMHLEDHTCLITTLESLLRGNDDDMLIVYQICFDLYENASQNLLCNVVNGLRKIKPCHNNQRVIFQSRMRNLDSILKGNVTTELYLHFLVQNNKTDNLILENMKDCRDPVCYSAIVFATSLMNCGTVSDRFVIDHIDWWCQETNWAEFSATAGLGVINKGNEQDSIGTLSSYFPGGPQSKGKYAEAGCMYGLGLIHANHGEMIIDYLVDQLQCARSLEVIHGCCLGIGLAALGTNRQDIYKLLRVKLLQNEAIIGESVGIAMGLIAMGSKADLAVKEMIDFAHDTKHEKIVRGLAIGIGLAMFGRLEECELIVASLWNDREPFLRCAAMHILAMAYSGTGNNKIVRRLLSAAINDPNNDVRRAAIQALGFVFLNDSCNCVSAVSLLADSYNLDTRYGAALAMGISCAGSGNKEALSLLWNLADDVENLVVQGALIASAIILIQHTTYTSSKLSDFQALYQEIIDDKLENEITKFGAILAQGIINAGGRNVTISLKSRSGQNNMAAIAGMLIFTQYWYWFPLVHFLSLTFLPTCLIGINGDLQMPQMEFTSNAKPSNFGYPPPTKRRKKSDDCEIMTFILSFAMKMKTENIQEIRIESEEEEVEDDGKEIEDVEYDENLSEADFEIIRNPSRVTLHQMRFVEIPEGSRYEAVKTISKGGIIVMRDKQKGMPEELVKPIMLSIEEDDDDESVLYQKAVNSEGDLNDV